MNLGIRLLRLMCPGREKDRREVRAGITQALAHAEDLNRTIIKFNNGGFNGKATRPLPEGGKSS